MSGYQIGSIKAVPDQVVIEGSESELKNVTEVTTEDVDVAGVNSGFSLIVPLLHRGTYTWFKSEKITEIQVEIEPVATSAEDPPAIE